MLNEHTVSQLRSLRLDGMVHALHDAATSTAAATLPFEERFALIVQREIDWRDAKRIERLLKAAKLKVNSACLEDIDWRSSRGLDRAQISALAGADWLRHAQNVLITGATGVGKTWLACALAQQAARSGSPRSTCARRVCSRNCASRTATAPSIVVSRNLHASICSPSTISPLRQSPRPSATICWNCSMTASARAPH